MNFFSKKNRKNALFELSKKANTKGSDGMSLSELGEYLLLNEERIIQEIKDCKYIPKDVKIIDIIKPNGNKRYIAKYETLDRYICKLIALKFKKYLEPLFLPSSFAYQENKGIQKAVEQAKLYIETGNEYVVKIDIDDFFGNINHKRMMDLLKGIIKDKAILYLINQYLCCKTEHYGEYKQNTIGLIQGNPISPTLSNLYAHELDCYMEDKGYMWTRFSDDIAIFTNTKEEAFNIYTDIENKSKQLLLNLNKKKSGIYNFNEITYLGYNFFKNNNGIEIKKHIYKRIETYYNWHPSVLKKINHEYHIVKNGILNKKDYEILFENNEEKHVIPIEAIDQINVYNDITISSSAIKTFVSNNTRLNIVNHYGEYVGSFIPVGHTKTTYTLINQCNKYNNINERNEIVYKLESAYIHNLISNIKYYLKKTKNKKLNDVLKQINEELLKVKENSSDINKMMLVEARARQIYYHSFKYFINNKDFIFTTRTKQPPKDPINALISFLNTLMYNECAKAIYKTSLDIRIGIIHASNNRKRTLNLDFADLFKPIISDRVIFSTINLKMINKNDHFEINEEKTLLNNEGKKIIIESFMEKMDTSIVVKNKKYTYRQLIENEVFAYLRYVNNNGKYNPYKYY